MFFAIYLFAFMIASLRLMGFYLFQWILCLVRLGIIIDEMPFN